MTIFELCDKYELSLSPDTEDMLKAITKLSGHHVTVPEDIEAAIDCAIVREGGDPSMMTLREKRNFLVDAAFK